MDVFVKLNQSYCSLDNVHVCPCKIEFNIYICNDLDSTRNFEWLVVLTIVKILSKGYACNLTEDKTEMLF